MLPLLSSNINTKSILIQFNIIPILERYLHIKYDYKIQRYCLLTLRNLSDQIIHMVNIDSYVNVHLIYVSYYFRIALIH